MFYFVSAGISAQYLVWILPFAVLSRDKMLKYYTVIATIALLGYYLTINPEENLGHGLWFLAYYKMFFATIYTIFNFLLWIVCGIWIYKLYCNIKDITNN